MIRSQYGMDLSNFHPYLIAIGTTLLILPALKFVFGKPSNPFMGISILLIGFIVLTTPFWSSIAVEFSETGWKLNLQKEITKEQAEQIEILEEVLASKVETPSQEKALSSFKHTQKYLLNAQMAPDRETARAELSRPEFKAASQELKAAFTK